MHTGRSYRLLEFLDWTRRKIYVLLVLGTVPVLLYQLAGLKWLGIPWTAVAFLGTATAFIVGFKNVQTYNRTWEARQIWGEILSASRAWGAMARDNLNDPEKTRLLVLRHVAWLTALRYQMRKQTAWETLCRNHNEEYRRLYSIPERESPLEGELAKYLPPAELEHVLGRGNTAAQVLALQSGTLKEIYGRQDIVVLQFVDMQRAIRDFFLLQGRSERIKNFPYPSQFTVVSSIFVKLFCLLLPFGLLNEFDKLNAVVAGPMQGQMVWLAIPFSVVISWTYTSLEQVGESTENPFEGGANDVPISQLSRKAEIDMREMLGDTDLPPPLEPRNNIVL
jgi:putative membrane protein